MVATWMLMKPRGVEFEGDAEAVNRARQGDASAFDQLFQRHFPRVYNFALRIDGDPERAADAAQGAFVKVHAGLGKIRDGQAFVQLLYKSALNLVRDRARRDKRRPTVSTDTLQGFEPSSSPSETFETILATDRQDALEKAIANLPDEFRDVVVLHHLQDMDLDQIATIVGVPVGTVKSRLGRGRARLREALKDWMETD